MMSRKPEFYRQEFLQAVYEVFDSLQPYVEKHPELEANGIMERLVEPDRMVSFRVAGWMTPQGAREPRLSLPVQLFHRPIQGRSSLPPHRYPFGHQVLGFEQIFKNSLTSLPLGGGKGRQ